MERFVLLATRRSGTTLFSDVMNSTGQVHFVKRAFGMERRIKNPTADRHSGRFFLYRTASLSRRLRFYLARRELLSEFLAQEIFHSPEAKEVAGFRLTYGQAEQYPQVIEWLGRQQVKLIHLVRENVLKTYVSETTAPIHKMRHPRKGAKLRTVRISLDAGRIRGILDQRVGLIERMRECIRDVPHLEVAYESFSSNRAAELARILPFLGISAIDIPGTDLVKINPDTLADIITNYEEVAAALRGTPHERFLD